MTASSRFASIALVALMLAVWAIPLTRASSESVDITGLALTPSDTISIYGNDEFTAENGVVSGSGSSGDPYIIEGWEIILNNTGTAIVVADTDRYFVIRDVHVIGAKIGIRFDGVYHGRVTETWIDNCLSGFSAAYSEVSRLDNCVVSNCSTGISLRYCDAFKVTDITYLDNDQDLRIIALPWIETRQADLLFAVIAVIMLVFVALLLYLRFKAIKPPDERP